jgi:signal peptidase I
MDMEKKTSSSWIPIFLRIYGVLHLIAGFYLLWGSFQRGFLEFLLLIASILMLIAGFASLFVYPWGAFPITALALAITFFITTVVPIILHPPHISEEYLNIIQIVSILVMAIEWFTTVIYWRLWWMSRAPMRPQELEVYRRRKPILALIFSIITPGLGQIYNGQLKKGIIFYLVEFLIVVFLILSGLFFKFFGMIFSLVIILGFFLFILVDALFGAIKLKENASKSYNKWYIYLAIFLINGFVIQPLLSWTIRSNIVRAYKIPSSTMEPTLLVGDHLIANMKIYKSGKPKRGDIIIFEYPKDPSKDFIKRVIGLEEEKAEIINNKIYINEKLLDDPWGYFEDVGSVKGIPELEKFGPAVVPKDSLFVLGDNRNNSQDSRFGGFVNIKKVKGKALYLYWAKNKSRIGMELK